MDCQQITHTPVALEILQTQGGQRLQALFHCIYTLFQGSFLSWIFHRYSHHRNKDRLLADAKDAFQNGVMAFYLKSQQAGFEIKGSLKTAIYSFGLLQLLACFKRERTVYVVSDYLDCLDMLFEDELFETERQELLNEQEQEVIEALRLLPENQRAILSMRFFEHLKSRQIAERLEISTGHVNNESARAYKALRHLLKTKMVQNGTE